MENSTRLDAVRVTIPGKIFVAGEYAVLRGETSLSASIGARLAVTVERQDTDRLIVHSSLWPEPRNVDTAAADEPLIQSLKFLRERHGIRGATITVESELSVAYGLGSSSAVRLGVHLGFAALYHQTLALDDSQRWLAAREAWRLQAELQGFASGYDFVTQLEGGYLEWQPDFENWPGPVKQLDINWLKNFVHPYAGGQGAPTATVGGGVRRWLDENPARWTELETKTRDLVAAFLSQNIEQTVQANEKHATFFRQAPFYPTGLYNLLARLPEFGRSWTFKTTGAGGEDAILLIGPRSELTLADSALRRQGWRPLPWSWTNEGSTLSLPLVERLS